MCHQSWDVGQVPRKVPRGAQKRRGTGYVLMSMLMRPERGAERVHNVASITRAIQEYRQCEDVRHVRGTTNSAARLCVFHPITALLVKTAQVVKL